MSKTESFQEYYRPMNVISFGEQVDGYLGSIEHAYRQVPSLIDANEPKVFVLGGFYPYNSTQYDFVNFCRNIRTPQIIDNTQDSTAEYDSKNSLSANDRYLLLDMNKDPLVASHDAQFPLDARDPMRVQADVTQLPFFESVDMIFLDHTQIFMNNEKFSKVAQSIASALKQNGILTVMNVEPLVPFIARFKGARQHKVPIYPRRDRSIIKEFSRQLKLVSYGVATTMTRGVDYSAVTFARQDSDYREFKGYPFVFSGN